MNNLGAKLVFPYKIERRKSIKTQNKDSKSAKTVYFCIINKNPQEMIELSNITRSFGALQVLKGISLKVDKGEVISITGPSGAGKTITLIY